MPSANLGEISLEYESFGNPSDPGVLLIMGVGAQLTFWPVPFCDGLASHGFHVIRFDNRDVGKSSHLIELGVPDLREVSSRVGRGEAVEIPYSLDDMALDVVGLMDTLRLSSAHIVGVSLGGMIAQLLALHHSERVRSLVSIMSTTGRRELPQAAPEVMAAIMAPPLSMARDDLIAARMQAMRVIESPAYAAGQDELSARVAESVDRVPYEPTGTARQMAAIFAAPPRHEPLGSISCPTLVIHGSADRLMPFAAGEDTANCISGAELCAIEGMGHDLTDSLTPVLLEKIVPFLQRVAR